MTRNTWLLILNRWPSRTVPLQDKTTVGDIQQIDRLLTPRLHLTDDAVDPRHEAGDVGVHRGTSDLGAGLRGEGDHTQQDAVLQHGATGVSVADSDSSGQRASAHVLLLQVNSESGQRGAARGPVDDGHLDLLQEGRTRRQDSGRGLAPSSEDGHTARDGSGSGQDGGLDPVVVAEGRLQTEL